MNILEVTLPDTRLPRPTNPILEMGSKRFEGLHNLHLRNLFITNEIHDGKRDEWIKWRSLSTLEDLIHASSLSMKRVDDISSTSTPPTSLNPIFLPFTPPLRFDNTFSPSFSLSLFASILIYKWTVAISRQISLIQQWAATV